jgi:hypothetical protein
LNNLDKDPLPEDLSKLVETFRDQVTKSLNPIEIPAAISSDEISRKNKVSPLDASFMQGEERTVSDFIKSDSEIYSSEDQKTFISKINPDTQFDIQNENEENRLSEIKKMEGPLRDSMAFFEKFQLQIPEVLKDFSFNSIKNYHFFINRCLVSKEKLKNKQEESIDENIFFFNVLKTISVFNDIEKIHYSYLKENEKEIIKDTYKNWGIEMTGEKSGFIMTEEGEKIEFKTTARLKDKEKIAIKLLSKPHKSIFNISDIFGFRFITKNDKDAGKIAKHFAKTNAAEAFENKNFTNSAEFEAWTGKKSSSKNTNKASGANYRAINMDTSIHLDFGEIASEVQITTEKNYKESKKGFSAHVIYDLNPIFYFISRYHYFSENYLKKLVKNCVQEFLACSDLKADLENKNSDLIKEYEKETGKSFNIKDFQHSCEQKIINHFKEKRLVSFEKEVKDQKTNKIKRRVYYKDKEQMDYLPWLLLREEERVSLRKHEAENNQNNYIPNPEDKLIKSEARLEELQNEYNEQLIEVITELETFKEVLNEMRKNTNKELAETIRKNLHEKSDENLILRAKRELEKKQNIDTNPEIERNYQKAVNIFNQILTDPIISQIMTEDTKEKLSLPPESIKDNSETYHEVKKAA